MVGDQAARLRSLMQKRNNQTEAKTIAVFSGKGGVGKSNFVINLAYSLTKHDQRVLVIDLDIGMGNIDILIGQTIEHSMVDLLDKKLSISEVIKPINDRLSLIAGGSGLSRIFEVSYEKQLYFLNQFQQLFSQFDFILLDLGAGMSKSHLAFIEASHESIVVITPEPTSIMDGYAAVKHVLAESTQSTPTKLSVLVNRTTNNREGLLVYERLRQVIEQFIGYSIEFIGSIPQDRAVVEAVKRQKAFYEERPRAEVSKSIERIAIKLLDKENATRSRVSNRFIDKMKVLFRQTSN